MLALATAASIVTMIVGHPFPVSCHSAFDPGRPANGALGVTHFTNGRPTSVDLYGVCQWLGVPIAGVDADALAQGLLVTLHEAELVRLADMDEAEAQACALDAVERVVSPAIARQLGGDSVARAIARHMAGAIGSDARRLSGLWPAVYQGGACRR